MKLALLLLVAPFVAHADPACLQQGRANVKSYIETKLYQPGAVSNILVTSSSDFEVGMTFKLYATYQIEDGGKLETNIGVFTLDQIRCEVLDKDYGTTPYGFLAN